MHRVDQYPPRRNREEETEPFLSFSTHSVLYGAIHLLLIDEDSLLAELDCPVSMMETRLGES